MFKKNFQNSFTSKKRFSGSSTSVHGASAAPRKAGAYSSSGPRRFGGGAGGPAKFSRPSFGGSKRFGGGGQRGGGYSAGGGRRGPGKGENISHARFINKVAITEETVHFTPEHAFTDFAIADTLKKGITAKGYKDPTPIQDRTIPHILKGLDVVGIANTGTGKTAAFLIPLINKVILDPKEKIIIIVPTRELAIQIEDELKGFTKGMKIFSVCCVGGVGIGKQISYLKYQYNFVIGTPGRIKDLVERKHIRLNEFKTIVLDEADRMLDMGFVHDMRFVVSQMPTPRHTLFFSATISPDVEKLIKDFLTEPVRISVKTQDTSKNVEQDVVRVPRGGDKLEILHDLLNQKEFAKVLIFGRTKHGVEKLSKMLTAKGFKAESIHGDKNNSKRQHALGLFKSNNIQILVATDVAARGLDIPDVSHVINYDIPATYDDYVHRIGQTRSGSKKGKALTFVD